MVEVHHNPTGPEGRPWMLVNGGSVWHLTEDERHDLYAELALKRAELMSLPVDAGHPDWPGLTGEPF